MFSGKITLFQTRAMFLAWTAAFFAPALVAAQVPAAGKVLVSTEDLRGDAFSQTVVLLLHYDEAGAQGLVINRPMPSAPKDVLAGLDGIEDYQGTLFWGGPVQLASLRVLMRTAVPPPDSHRILDGVYLVPPERSLLAGVTDSSRLRFFVGYAGWSPGQLDNELRRRSWDVLPGSEDLVFAEDPRGVWKLLMRPTERRVSNPPGQKQPVAD